MLEILRRCRRLALVTAVLPFFAVAASCGGGSGGGGGSAGVTATFTPAAGPPAGTPSISLQSGTKGTQFSLIVSVKDVADFFGAAFSISYPITAAGAANIDYLGSNTSSSFLNGVGIDTVFIATDSGKTGVIDVVATRKQNQAGTVPGVTVGGAPEELLRLNFQVRRAMTNAAIDFTQVLEVCTDQPTGIPPVCAEVANVVWTGGTVTAQ